MSRTDAHRPWGVADRIDGREVADPLAFLYGDPPTYRVLPHHERRRHFPADSVARDSYRRGFNRRDRHAARLAIRAGEFDALAPRWAARGRVAWELT